MRSHGTCSRYTAGCRCDECRAANAAYKRAYYHARKPPAPEPETGGDARASVRGVRESLPAEMPWREQRYIDAALDVITEVRDSDNPGQLAVELAKIPPADAAALIMTLGMMIWPHRTVADLSQSARLPMICRNGHPMTPDAWRIDPQGFWRCRHCDRRPRALSAAS